MEYSKQGLALTENFESCRLTAYRDIKGVLTIGYGHTGPDVVEGLVWTQDQADTALVCDTQHEVNTVNRLVTIELSQTAFDALVDFVFNVGSGNFAGSTMLKLLNSGDTEGAAAQFDAWDHSNGQVISGLLRRRRAEESEFEGA
jgi:lysozyme